MPLYKSAQFATPSEDQNLFVIMPAEEPEEEILEVEDDGPGDEDGMEELIVSDDDDEVGPSFEDMLGLGDGDSEPKSVELSFALPRLPGAEDHELIVSDDDEEETKEEKKDDKPKDWQDMPKKEFLSWFRSYLDKIPKHKGETIALERAQAYLKKCLDILSKSVQQDFDGEIDIAKADDARAEIENGMNRLEKELGKRRKKASEERASLTKEGQKAPAVGGIVVTVPIGISAIARACINAVISNGKDLNDTFQKLSTKYNLTDREKMETIQLLKDMNMPIRRDLNMLDDDEYGYGSENNFTYSPNYHA